MEIEQIVRSLSKDQKARQAATRENVYLFFLTYFSHYIEYKFAPFHHEMFKLVNNLDNQTLVVTAARGVGKSTILNMATALWSILGRPATKFVVIASQTQDRAKQHFKNIRKELEENRLLKQDLGPFQEETSEWGSTLVIPRYNARIMFVSAEQSLRGLRHMQWRPDLVIVDDPEDANSVRTYESRNKTYEWLNTDVIPAGSSSMRLVVIGTILHEDSLVMRLKREIEKGSRSGVYRSYPLIDENSNSTWPDRYPDKASLDKEKARIGDERAWLQEYCLILVSDANRVIEPSWISYYDDIPDPETAKDFRGIYLGIDFAISEKSTADMTAVVTLYAFGHGDDLCLYVAPNPFNKQVNLQKFLDYITEYTKSLYVARNERRPTVYAEDNGTQKIYIEVLEREGVYTKPVTSQADKRVRLSLASAPVKRGVVRFPKRGAEALIAQIVNLGSERHDDLADAFSLVVREAYEATRGGNFFENWPMEEPPESILDMIF